MNLNCNPETLQKENEVLRELLEEYKKIGMTAPEETSAAQHKGKVILSDYPFDVIVKCNKYYYDVVEVLTERGLGRAADVDSFKQELEAYIAKANGASDWES